MMTATVEQRPWSRQRWGLTIALVLHLQAGLIFLLEKSSSAPPRGRVAVSQIHLRERLSLEPLAISDPTLFVLPHLRGFSGEAWLNRATDWNFQPTDWTEPPRPLPLATAQLGADFKEFITANPVPPLATIATVEPPRAVPEVFPTIATVPERSSLRAGGALAQRPLLAVPELRVWESNELLAGSEVQLLVDASGQVVSTVLRSSGLGVTQAEADARALELARTVRFAPRADGTLTVGTLIFDWRTVPVPATNAPVAAP